MHRGAGPLLVGMGVVGIDWIDALGLIVRYSWNVGKSPRRRPSG